LHSHPNEDKTIYVLDGELLVEMDGERHRVGKHGVIVAPRGLPHAFLVTSETARLLCLQTPGSGEAFYRSAGEPVSSREDVNRPPDFERLRAVAADSPTIELLGPPPFDLAEEPAPA
jgi:uncharacterized cupin superfamily protein